MIVGIRTYISVSMRDMTANNIPYKHREQALFQKAFHEKAAKGRSISRKEITKKIPVSMTTRMAKERAAPVIPNSFVSTHTAAAFGKKYNT